MDCKPAFGMPRQAPKKHVVYPGNTVLCHMCCRKIVSAMLRLLNLLPLVAISIAASIALAGEPGKPPKSRLKEVRYLRLVREKDKTPLVLEAAIIRCMPVDRAKKVPIVDLVAAVHVADRSYYQQLNREFGKYDVVLYELVAPVGTKVPKGGGTPRSGVSMLQIGIKDMLDLEFQLSEIDYRRENMVHADMSPEQFADSMHRKGESVFSMFLRMMGYALARQQAGKATDVRFLLALFDKNRALALKRIMAEQFTDMQGSLMAIDGPDGSTIISERNKVAMRELRKQIASGKQKIAIFYGAAHMPDMLKRLRNEFGLAPVSARWLVVWNLKAQ